MKTFLQQRHLRSFDTSKTLFSILLLWLFFSVTANAASSIQADVTFQWAVLQPTAADPAEIESITVGGNLYNIFDVPTGYELTQLGPDGHTANHIREDGALLEDSSANSTWNASALVAYDDKNLNHYFETAGNGDAICNDTDDFSVVDSTDAQKQTLTYTPGITTNSSTLLAITERNANNCYHIELFGIPAGGGAEVSLGETFVHEDSTKWGHGGTGSSGSLGTLGTVNPPSPGSDYWLTDRVNEGANTIGIALFSLDDIAAVGSTITKIRLTAATEDHGDGKIFIVSQQKVLSVTSDTQTEGTDLNHTISLSNASSVATTYPFTIGDGNATEGTDYTLPTNAQFSAGVTYNAGDNTITVPAGVTSFTITVPTLSDGISDDDEFYTMNVGGVSGIGTIIDDGVLPVTISYAHPERYGNSLEVEFGTATETGNIGFNIYAIQGKRWVKLNQTLIPGSLDSFEPQEYHASLNIPETMNVKKIGIAGVDVDGKEDRHGPFKLGQQSGEKIVVTPINWKQVRAELNPRKEAKNAKRIAKRSANRTTKQLFKEDVVTLNVAHNALYSVSHKSLMAEGIDLDGFKASQIAISLKGQGVPRHIDGLSKGKWTQESTLTFMGKAPNVTDALYVKHNHYKLALSKNLVVESEKIEPLTVKETVIDQNKKYAYTLPLDDPFYEGFFYTRNENATAQYTSRFDMPEVLEEGRSELTIYAAVTTEGSHRMSITLNGTPIAETTAQSKSGWVITEEIENSLLQESDNALTFTLYGENDGIDIVAYDKLIIRSNTQEAIGAEKPEIVREDKISKKMLRVEKSTDYLIITHPLFMNETLDRYVAQRQGEGWNIQVVSVEDIYAAYSNSMAIPEAIQTYINEQISRGVTHVQLIGASNYDYHDYLGLGAVSLIPSLYTLTNGYIKYTPSDASYVMEDDSLPSIAIGRWPVRTLEEFENVINKTLSWRSTQNALLIADKTDNKGTDFTPQMREMEAKIQAGGYQTENVYLDVLNETMGAESLSVAREKIAESMMQGISILSYNGHGSPSQWSTSGMLKQSDIENIDTSTIAPIMLPFTCLSTYADSPLSNTMIHQLSATQNGAVAVYGSTTYSTYGNNGLMLGKVFEKLIAGETLGEAIKNTKHELGAHYRDVILNGNLLGDVTLKIQ